MAYQTRAPPGNRPHPPGWTGVSPCNHPARRSRGRPAVP